MQKALMDELELLSRPGHTIEETMVHKKIGLKEMAIKMDLKTITILGLIVGDVHITEEIAIKLQSVLNIDADFWMAREKNYREKLLQLAEKFGK